MSNESESDVARYWELRGKLEDLVAEMRDDADQATLPRARQLRADALRVEDVLTTMTDTDLT